MRYVLAVRDEVGAFSAVRHVSAMRNEKGKYQLRGMRVRLLSDVRGEACAIISCEV